MRLAALLLASCWLPAADWTLLRIPGIDLYTDASEKAAQRTIDRLEQIRSLLGTPAKSEPIPLRVVLFAKASEYQRYAPDTKASGFYQSGIERDYIVTSAATALDRVVAHEYVHFVTNDRQTFRPAWLEEGLADFYSTFDGKQIGAPIREHLQRLQGNNWLSADEMNSPRETSDLFYAQSWALVHMLRREAAFPERVTPRMVTELRQYVRTIRAVGVKVPAATSVPSVQAVSPLDALLVRGDLALRTGHPDLARTLYAQSARDFPNSSAAATGLAVLAIGDGNVDRATAELHRALELNDRDARAWFELAVLTNDSQALRRVVALDPSFAEAHVLLGVRATDSGDLETALEHLERATALMPRKSYAWYSLGYAQQKHGDMDAARQSLTRALQLAATPEQRSMAATLLDSLP